MKSMRWLSICVALLWAGVMSHPVVAGDAEAPDCLKTKLAPVVKVAACRAAAENGDAKAQYTLGLLYENGIGMPQNSVQAVVWYRRAAEQENAAAQHSLGVLYAEGQGMLQDHAEAVTWFHRAAENGNVEGQYMLGLLYALGQGVPQDDTLAHMWFNLASASGYKKAFETRDKVAEKMTPSQIAAAQQLAQEWVQAHRAGGKSPGPGR